METTPKAHGNTPTAGMNGAGMLGKLAQQINLNKENEPMSQSSRETTVSPSPNPVVHGPAYDYKPLECFDGGRAPILSKTFQCQLCSEPLLFASHTAVCITKPGAKRHTVAKVYDMSKAQSKDFHEALGQPFQAVQETTKLACYKCVGLDLFDNPVQERRRRFA